MHFCDKCNNMLYVRLLEEDTDTLIYYCRNCGNTGEPLTKENIFKILMNIQNLILHYHEHSILNVQINLVQVTNPVIPKQKVKLANLNQKMR
jgi:DNA-directed RNA polymerase subunit M/transcription elongation factor TFIIS